MNPKLRFRVPDGKAPESVWAELEARGFKPHEDVTKDEAYYRGPGLDPGEELRLRHEHGGADDFTDNLTWIGRANSDGSQARVRIDVTYQSEIHDLLAALCYQVELQFRKNENWFRRDHILAVVVTVDVLGAFLELRATNDAPDTPAVSNAMVEEARALGFGPGSAILETYPEMLRRAACPGPRGGESG